MSLRDEVAAAMPAALAPARPKLRVRVPPELTTRPPAETLLPASVSAELARTVVVPL